MTVIIGLDPSLNGYGYAVIRTAISETTGNLTIDVLEASTLRVNKIKGSGQLERTAILVDNVVKRVAEDIEEYAGEDVKIVMELPLLDDRIDEGKSYHARRNASNGRNMDIGIKYHTSLLLLKELGVVVAGVDPRTPKKVATGLPHATKEAMMLATEQIFGPNRNIDHNAADAIWIAVSGAGVKVQGYCERWGAMGR